MPRTINFLGSIALLVSSITGPSLVVIPLLFQQAGWLTPLLTFVAISLLSGAAALFLVETMSSIEGNEEFQASVEFTTLAHLYLGKRWHIIVQGVLYLAMQSLVVASLLESFQSMDGFLISIAHKTCAVSFTHGWVCTSQLSSNGSSAFSGYILGSFGTLITLFLILPLSVLQLVDNIIVQVASFILLLIVAIVWIVIFAVNGLSVNPIPVVGHDQSTVAGFVLSNFAFVTTIPAWVNNTHPSVNIRRAVWLSILISCLIYIPIGWMGGSAFALLNGATLLQVLGADTGHGALSVLAKVSSYAFPLAVLITSIPVFAIVIRYNLLRGNICSNKMAIFWSAIFPWFIVIPFQTNGALGTILNWASLIFASPSNLLFPFILFIVSKRHFASAVLDPAVSPEVVPVSELSLPLTPAGPMVAPSLTTTPTEHIPVVIITDSTDGDGDNTTEVKSLVSASPDAERTSSDTVPMQVMNRVSSPSRHRYYGQRVVAHEAGGGTSDRPVLLLDTTCGGSSSPAVGRTSLSTSLSPSHSGTHPSGRGMDEFLLITPTSPRSRPRSRSRSRAHSVHSAFDVRSLPPSVESPEAARDALSADGGGSAGTADVRIAMATPTPGDAGQRAAISPVFKAFPGLPPTSPVRATRVSAVGLVVAAALVLTALVYNIVQSAGGR